MPDGLAIIQLHLHRHYYSLLVVVTDPNSPRQSLPRQSLPRHSPPENTTHYLSDYLHRLHLSQVFATELSTRSLSSIDYDSEAFDTVLPVAPVPPTAEQPLRSHFAPIHTCPSTVKASAETTAPSSPRPATPLFSVSKTPAMCLCVWTAPKRPKEQTSPPFPTS